MNPSLNERRKHERLGLRLPVRFSGIDGSPAISCFTENISSNGFYCVTPEPLVPGEHRDVHLMLPARGYSRSGANVDLKCQIRVVRIEPAAAAAGYGVACQIEKYALTWEETPR